MAFNVVNKVDDNISVKNVLISVSDKKELEPFISGLIKINPEIKLYSTGGTFKKIEQILAHKSRNHLMRVSEYTGQPEMQGGLVKTLDFKIYLGILNETYNTDHQQDLQRIKAVEFDLVAVNLYPFQQTVAQPDITFEQARGNIDIGGPCMLRASAKNFIRVASVCDPGDYQNILDELAANNCRLSLETRSRLAKKSFSHTAAYDKAISEYLLACDYSFIKNSYFEEQ